MVYVEVHAFCQCSWCAMIFYLVYPIYIILKDDQRYVCLFNNLLPWSSPTALISRRCQCSQTFVNLNTQRYVGE